MPDGWNTWSRLDSGHAMDRWASRRLHVYRGLCAMDMMVDMRAWRRWKRTMLDGKWCGRRT